MNRRLYRSTDERVLAGVAGGVAEYFDLDPALVRVAWALLILASGGIFLLLYLVMWFVVPEAPPGMLSGQPWDGSEPGATGSPEGATGEPAAGSDAGAAGVPPMGPPSVAEQWVGRRRRRRHRSGGGGILIGSFLVLLGAWFLAQEYVPWLRSADLWPIALILVGAALLIGAMTVRAD